MEAALPAPAAEALGLAPGDDIALAAIGDPTRKVDVRLTGTYRVDDPRDPFWWGHRLETGGERTIDFTTYGPFVVNENAFAPVAGSEANLAWRAALSPSRITVASLPKLREDVSTLQGHLNEGASREVSVDTGLVTVLDRTDHLLTVTRSGVLIPSVQLAILAGAALLFLAGLLSERRGLESAIMRSRGAGGEGVAALAVMEGALLAVPAAILAPWVAVFGLQALNHVGPLAQIGLELDPHVTTTSYVLAVLAALLCVAALALPALRSGAVTSTVAGRGRPAAEELRPARRPRPDSRRGRPHRVLAAPPLRRARRGERSGEARHRPAAHRGTCARPPRRRGSRAARRSGRGLAGRAGRELGEGDGGRARDEGAGAPAPAIRALGSPSDARARDRPLRLRLQPHLARVPARPGRLRRRRGRAGRAERALGVDPRAPASGCLREPERRALRPSRLPRGARPVGFVRARDPARDRRGSDGRGGQLSGRPGEPPACRDARSPRREPSASCPGPASRPAHAARARRRRGGRPSARGPRVLRDRCAPLALRRDQGRRRPPLPPAHDRLRGLGSEEAHRLRPLRAARRGPALSTLARRSGDERDPVLPRRTGLYRSTCIRWRWATAPEPSRGSTRRISPGR